MMETSNLESVAERYRQRGYQIDFEPDARALPKEAKALQPDFLASKGDEHIIVEVKHPRNLLAYPALTRLAETIRRIPGWRLDVIVLEEPKPAQHLAPLSIDNAKRRMDAADRVANETADYGAALLLLWTAAEGVLRDKLKKHTGNTPTSTSRLPKLAYSLGLINAEDFPIAEWMTRIRNDVVHGQSQSVVSRADYDRAHDFVLRLLIAEHEPELLAS
ncbi:MAG TPA: hypothetical protein VE863_21660 [Pyrinomonadaceae bacterium]|jgi:hypothetical protein|nr:hypothetical protein [Pyrinomonadaceae bacterium]